MDSGQQSGLSYGAVMLDFASAVFLFTYAGVALGRLPGLALDRTGIALLGAIAMVVSGALSLERAVAAVDLSTILLLYALMIVSAQLRLGGFYTWSALRVTVLLERPRLFLLVSMLLAALLSALLANDIVCLAFAPVIATSLLRAGRSPLPFLLGLAIASNIGSAATIIGNPQNMLIGQLGGLHFGRFLLWCGPPSLLALGAGYLLILRLHQKDFSPDGPPVAAPADVPAWPDFDRWQSAKGLAATLVLVGLFFTPVPREFSALAVAGLLLCSRRMHSREILSLVDWHLITLFCGLFVVIQGIEDTGLPVAAVESLRQQGIALDDLTILSLVSILLSNLVSNVPATMLLTRFLDPAQPALWYALAVSSTFAGNLILIGSIANLIVVEQAARLGVRIAFARHARTGVPVTLVSLLVLFAWIWLLG
jgi:Na+/H+ antiporter NhaD/arsenite permease-like protein